MPETTTPNHYLPNWAWFSSLVCVVCPFPRLSATHMARYVIWNVYHFLVTPYSGYRSQSRKLMSPGNQEHRSLGESFQTGTWINLLPKVIPACCLYVFLSFLFLCSPSFFLLFCRPVFIFHSWIFLHPFFCTSFVFSVFSFFPPFVSYVVCPYFQACLFFRSFMSSSSSLVVFLHTIFSFLIIYSRLSSYMCRYVWYPSRPRRKNTCPPLLHMLWCSFTSLVSVLVVATKPLHALVSSIVDIRIRIRSTSGAEVL